jgi:non-heme chloroperoxidase
LYKDWGSGPPVVFSHGWPLNADAWDDQMVTVASQGFRAIAHDRRSHGRSGQSWGGHGMDAYADDLASLIGTLALHDVTLVGHSTGGGEVTRYAGWHGTGRVGRMVLLGAVPPLMLKTEVKSRGAADRDLRCHPSRRRGGPVAILQGPQRPLLRRQPAGLEGRPRAARRLLNDEHAGRAQGALDRIKAFSETDFTEDPKRIDEPVLVIHAEDDQIVPIDAAGRASAKLLRHAALKVHEGAPHGISSKHKDRFNTDLLEFLRS